MRQFLQANLVDFMHLVIVPITAAFQANTPSRPPRRGRRAPAADCEPLF